MTFPMRPSMGGGRKDALSIPNSSEGLLDHEGTMTTAGLPQYVSDACDAYDEALLAEAAAERDLQRVRDARHDMSNALSMAIRKARQVGDLPPQ